MAVSDTALVVIDVQESFRQRPYWTAPGAAQFFDRLQALIDGAKKMASPSCRYFMWKKTGSSRLHPDM
jgi:nicotinamidase-related amidase